MDARVELADVERPLALFAQGISGRPYRIQPESDFDGGFERLSSAALQTPTTLYLPEAFDRYPSRSANAGGLRLIALHQLCYREFGSHEFRIDEARARCPRLTPRDASASSPRESDLTTLFTHFGSPALARSLFRTIEAARVDHAMRRRYPGIESHYQRFASDELAQRCPATIRDLGGLLEALVLLGLDVPGELLAALDDTGLVKPLADCLAPLSDDDADVYTSCDVLVQVYALLEAATVTLPYGQDPFDGPAAPAIHGEAPLELLQREERLDDWNDQLAALEEALADAEALELGTDAGTISTMPPLLDALDSLAAAGDASLGETRPEGLLPAPDAADLTDERDTLKRRIDMEQGALRAAFGAPPHEGKSFLYDEWDENRQTYLRSWCRLFEITQEPVPGEDGRSMLKRIASLRDAVRRRFEHLRPQAFTRTRKVLEGDELDWDQVLAYRVDRHRTASPDERVYQRRDRTNRDVTAAFLVDLSASTDDPIEIPEDSTTAGPEGTPNLRDPFDDDTLLWSLDGAGSADEPRRRIIDVQREALLLMADALDRLGDRFAVYGFSGYGRDCVELYVAKDFRAAWNSRAVNALAAMKPRRSTRMGPAIRHSTRRLLREGGGLKVLVVVSDGFPQDCDYGPDRSSHDYGVADTAKALQEAERAGISTFCITVDRSGHDYLKRMCDASRYMVIDEIETLPDALSKVYEALTT